MVNQSARESEEDRIREALTLLDEVQRALADSAVMSITDPEGCILEVNPFMCALTGYSREELLGQNHRILNSGYHPNSFFRELWATIQSGGIWRAEIRNRAKDGHFYWVDTVIVPRMGSDGRPVSYTSLRTDITRLKQVEEELKTSEAHIALAMDAARAGFWNWDLETNLVQRSPRTNEILGLPEGAPPTSPFLTSVHPEDTPRLERDLHDHFSGRVAGFTANFRLLHGDGHWVRLESHGRVVARDEHGSPLRMLGLVMDRTEQKRQEATFRETQKLESLGLLATGIAHDFNNLLQAVQGQAELAEAMAKRGQDPAAHFAEMRNILEHSRTLLRQLMDYAGGNEVARAPLELRALVREIWGLLALSHAEKTRLEVREGTGPLHVLASRGQLEQVVVNLVINAGEAMGPEGGLITLRTEKAVLSGTDLNEVYPGLDLRPGPHALLEVEDTGCGMDEATLARIFDPFFTTKKTGRGLGLAALQGILRAHRGGISVRSRPGEGSLFRVFLPLEASPEDAPTVTSPAP